MSRHNWRTQVIYYKQDLSWPVRSVLVLGMIATFPAAAAEERRTASQSGIIDEIVVTAQKREQSLQEVPISVTALRGEDLQQRGAEGLTEFTRLVPGLSYVDYGPGGQRNNRPLIIRGIDSSGEFAAPSVGYYIDETPISVADTKLFDLERIEVLRGPQGTLYGVGTAGGTIKLITKQPRLNTFEGAAELTGLYNTEGDDPGGRVNGMLNLPLGDQAALRVSAYYRNEPGYMDSVEAPPGSPAYQIANTRSTAEKDFNDQRVRGARASLLFQPNDRVSITPSVYLQRNDIGGEPVHAPLTVGDLKIARETQTGQETDFKLYSLTARFDVGFADLISITSHQKNVFEGREDITDLVRSVFLGLPPGFAFELQAGVPFPITDERKQFSQEVRLSSNGDGRVQWLVGAFYQKREREIFQGVVFPGIDDMTALDIPGDLVAAYDDNLEIEEYAGFTEVTFEITPRLRATGGARYFNIQQDTNTVTGGFFFGGGSQQAISTKEDGIRPKLQLSFDATDNLMLYATAAEGFSLGGVAPEVPDTAACRAGLAQLGVSFPVPTGYDADSIWNYEIGGKSDWFDGRMVLNASLYYIDRTNVAQTTTIPGGCGFNVTQNVGKVSSRGGEIELNTQLSRNLRFDLALGYTDAQLESNDPANPEARAGDRLLLVPEWTVSGALEYRRSVLADTEGFVRADYQYIGNRADNFVEPDPLHLLPSYKTANLRIGVDRDQWSGVVFLDNAFNERARLSNWSFGHGYGAFHTLQPRTVGVTLRRDF